MNNDTAASARRLAEWMEALERFSLPDWEALPQLDLYMDQVVLLLTRYLEPMYAGEDERFITASIINNYVRMKVMPPPVKKKYSRAHIAYLVIICALKQSLSISQIQQLLPEDREKLAKCVGGGFSAVSLRERTDADWVEKLIGRPVRDVLDPVLLLDRGEWEALSRPPAAGDAIVVYATQPNEDLMEQARALSARLGRRIVSLSRPDTLSRDPGSLAGIQMELDGGPREFLGWIRSACCVLTNSFHATAFSALLEKPFLSFRHSGRSVRQTDLLRKLGLSSRLWDPDREDLWTGTDWAAVRGRLAEERAASRRFILENL